MTEAATTRQTLTALVEHVNTRVSLGDRDKQRSENHYLAAGLHLIELEQRLPVEAPETSWPDWMAQQFPAIGQTRIYQLMRIGRGETTQSALNAASAESHRNSYQAAPRQRTAAEEDVLMAEILRQAEEWRRQDAARTEAATAEAVAAALAEAEAARNACEQELRQPAPAAERMSQMRARRRASRVEAGADLPASAGAYRASQALERGQGNPWPPRL